jgi:hypothetical protein
MNAESNRFNETVAEMRQALYKYEGGSNINVFELNRRKLQLETLELFFAKHVENTRYLEKENKQLALYAEKLQETIENLINCMILTDTEVADKVILLMHLEPEKLPELIGKRNEILEKLFNKKMKQIINITKQTL